jgi:hypothetical protein
VVRSPAVEQIFDGSLTIGWQTIVKLRTGWRSGDPPRVGERDGYRYGIPVRAFAVPRAVSDRAIYTRAPAPAEAHIGADYRVLVGRALVGDFVGSYLPWCSSMVARPPHRQSDRMQPNEPQSDDAADFDIGTEQWLLAPRPAAHYRAAAARARTLQATVTTARLKQHFGEMIARYERRAGEVESSEKG